MLEEKELKTLEDLIGKIVVGIVNIPEEASVRCTEDSFGVIAMIKTHPADVGYILGKKGGTITGLRLLARAFGSKMRCRLSIKVHDPNPKYDGIQTVAQ